MSKKGLFTGLLALLLMFVFLGCEPIMDSDQWTKVTSLDGLDGTWKSSVTMIGVDPDGKPIAAEQVTTMTYPASGKVSTETGGEVEIKDGVKTEMLSDGKSAGSILVPKNEFESMLKNGFEGPLGGSRTFLFVNSSKTRLKMESIINVEEDTGVKIKDEAAWKEFQDDYKKMAPTGDVTVTFSAGAPYTVTTTQILHKTSEVTDPGENPDSGTNPGTGTEPGTGEKPNDTWTKITSLDGLEGTWKYAYRDFGDTSNDNIYELINTTEFILFNETGDVSASYMTDHTQEVKELSLADNRPENEIWKEIQNIYKEIPSDFSYEFTQSEPYISKSFGTIPRAGEQGFETLLIGDGTNSCTYINESKTQLKMVSILESTIYVSETGSQRPIKDDAEWEQYKAQQAPFLPEGDMFVTYSKGETYLETVTTILHKQ